MAETSLNFSKIVATPTPSSWSQAYSAGKLFAVISLETPTPPQEGEEHLNSVGKDFISTLESEFFTIENKDLDSIKRAVEATISRIKEGVSLSFVLCYLNENVLYLYSVGGAKAILKRGDKVGSVIEAAENGEIKTASGYVQEEDLLILETKAFQKIIPTSTLASSLDNNSPDDIAETLAPNIHERQEGGASALILRYKELNGLTEAIPPLQDINQIETEPAPSSQVEETPSAAPVENIETEVIPQIPIEEPAVPDLPGTLGEPNIPPLSDTPKKRINIPDIFKSLKLPSMARNLPVNLTHQRRIFLTIGVIIVILIIATSVLALRNSQNTQDQELFGQVFNEAKTKYEEGRGLKDLNSELSRESFVQAKTILDQNKDKFSKGSSEQGQILSLLANVNRELGGGDTQTPQTEAKEVNKNESQLLSYAINNPRANYFTQNDSTVYFLDGTGVSAIDKGNDEKEQIIDKSWGEDGGIGLFGSNLYVLDKDDGVLKFVPSGNAYSESNYFTGDEPDLSSSASMAIDGSIYILFGSGTIQKYTRGARDTFNVSGVNGSFSSPSKIFTSDGVENIYILDKGNSRIVVLGKDGAFKSTKSSGLLKDAREFEVLESEKKIYFLSSGKVYELPL